MKLQTIVILITVLGLVNCKNKLSSDKEDARIHDATSIEKEVLDSTIFLNGINLSKYKGDGLILELAEEVLYQHFVKKGFFRPDEIPEVIGIEVEDKFAVYFDTIYLVNFNNNEFIDGVIGFWLTPPGASGHCWQPHKAIISDASEGYKITNEEFIPTNFAIDSVVNDKNKNMIYGIEYDCGNHQVLRNLEITLEVDEK